MGELEQARKAVQKANDERNALLMEVGGLRERVRHLDHENKELRQEVLDMRGRMATMEKLLGITTGGLGAPDTIQPNQET